MCIRDRTRDDGENGVGSLLESSTMEPVRLKIDEFPENTQETPQGSENSTSVVAPRLAQSEPEVENSRGSDAPEVAVKPLAVEPTRVSGSSRSQHVGKDGYSTVLGELKEEPREINDGDSKVSEDLKGGAREVDEAGDGKTQGRGDGGRAETRTEKVAEDTTELAWIEGYDPGHDCYYYHHVPTGESRWHRPDEPYEPYVHSDEEEDGEPSTLDEGGQSKDAQMAVREDRRDQGKHQRGGEKRSSSTRKSGREGGSGDRRKKRGQEEVERGATRATCSSSRRDKSCLLYTSPSPRD